MPQNKVKKQERSNKKQKPPNLVPNQSIMDMILYYMCALVLECKNHMK